RRVRGARRAGRPPAPAAHARPADEPGARPRTRCLRSQHGRDDLASAQARRGRPARATLPADRMGHRLCVRARWRGRRLMRRAALRRLFPRLALLLGAVLALYTLIGVALLLAATREVAASHT